MFVTQYILVLRQISFHLCINSASFRQCISLATRWQAHSNALSMLRATTFYPLVNYPFESSFIQWVGLSTGKSYPLFEQLGSGKQSSLPSLTRKRKLQLLASQKAAKTLGLIFLCAAITVQLLINLWLVLASY